MRSPLLTWWIPLVLVVLVGCATGNGDPTGEAPAPDPSSPSGQQTPPDAKPAATTPPNASAPPNAPNANAPPKGSDAGTPPPPTTKCPGYAAPTEAASCKCTVGKTCDMNNCYGGYYCETATTPPRCVRKPSTCP